MTDVEDMVKVKDGGTNPHLVRALILWLDTAFAVQQAGGVSVGEAMYMFVRFVIDLRDQQHEGTMTAGLPASMLRNATTKDRVIRKTLECYEERARAEMPKQRVEEDDDRDS